MTDTRKPVWIWLPDQAEPIVAGEYQLSVDGSKMLGSFHYDPSYRVMPQAIPLDQNQLSRYSGVSKTTDYEGLHDIFRDVKPEGFGLDMLQRNRAVSSLTSLQALEFSAGDAVGAIELCDNISEKLAFKPHSSQAMIEAMDFFDPATSSSHVVHKVAGHISTGLGGERPKMTVLHKGQQWIAKFADGKDDPTSTLREYVCMRLARLCGIDAAEVEYVCRHERGAILVKRFDRKMLEDGTCLRVHFASAATVLGAAAASRSNPNRTYIGLAMNAMRWGVRDHTEELWRRMAFNVLVGNADDHPRNHGFLCAQDGWKLSPAYDIAPNTPNGEHVQPPHSQSMGLRRNGDAGANTNNLLVGAKQLGIGYEEANDYLDSTFETLRQQWDLLAIDKGQAPLELPLFVLPPRAERISALDWRQVRN